MVDIDKNAPKTYNKSKLLTNILFGIFCLIVGFCSGWMSGYTVGVNDLEKTTNFILKSINIPKEETTIYEGRMPW